MKNFNKETGNIGEALATDFLKKKKYTILQTNYKNKIGEIDIIAMQNDVIVFIEVKTRSSFKFGLPREAINIYKQKKIINTATCYLKQKGLYDKTLVRFDCIEVNDLNNNPHIEHIENIF